VFRRIFGSKKEELTGGWRKLCNELQNLYPLSNIIRMIKYSYEMGGACSMHGGDNKYVQNFGWKA
jgi:hypothetical protein